MCSKPISLFSRCLLIAGIASAVHSMTTAADASMVVTSVYRAIGNTTPVGTVLGIIDTPPLFEVPPSPIYSVAAQADGNSTTTAAFNSSSALGTYNQSSTATSTSGLDSISTTASQNTTVNASNAGLLSNLNSSVNSIAGSGPTAVLNAQGSTVYQVYFIVDAPASYSFNFNLNVAQSGTGHFNNVTDYVLLEDLTHTVELSFHKRTAPGTSSGTEANDLVTGVTYRLTSIVNYSWSGPGHGSGGIDLEVFAIPEPATTVMALSGLMTFGMVRLARRRRSA